MDKVEVGREYLVTTSRSRFRMRVDGTDGDYVTGKITHGYASMLSDGGFFATVGESIGVSRQIALFREMHDDAAA